jgi:integrase/recombinase XerC
MPISEFTAYIKYIKFIRRYSPNTVAAYKTDLKQFKSYFRSNLLKVQRKDILDFIEELRASSISDRSIARKMISLRSYYSFCIKNSSIQFSPFRFIPSLKFNKLKREYIKQEKIIGILDSFDPGMNRKKVRDKLVVELLYFTGCRVNEIINLKKKDVDYKKASIKIIGKGKKERIVPVNQSLLELMKTYLLAWKNNNRTPYLLSDNKGKKIYAMFIWRLIKKYFNPQAININVSSHTIRHSIATHIYENGASLYDVQKFLSHTRVSSTCAYIHIDPEYLLRIYKKAHPKERIKEL